MFQHKCFHDHYSHLSGKYGFSILPSSLQSAICSCPHTTSRFLESVLITRTIVMLANKSGNFLPFSLSGTGVWHWGSTTPVHLTIYNCRSQLLRGVRCRVPLYTYSRANSCAITFCFFSQLSIYQYLLTHVPLTPQAWHSSTNVFATQQAY